MNRTRPRGRRGPRRSDDVPEHALCVLLLPSRLERFALRERAEDLLGAPGAVAVEPPAAGTLAALPQLLRDGIAAHQARRLDLPGQPRAIVVFEPLQYPLARALLALHTESELWYAGASGEPSERVRALHQAAVARAAFTFAGADAPGSSAREQNLPLWHRMEALGIESGRLGSERLDVR